MKNFRNNDAGLRAYQTALQAYGSGKYADAETILRALIVRQPRFADAHQLLGICHYVKGNLIEAERSIRKALAVTEHASFYLNLGLILQQAGDADGAEGAYSASLRLDPDQAQACNNLANILSGRKKYEEAVELYRRALTSQPNYALGHKNLGSCLVQLKRFDEAETPLRRAIALDGTLVETKLVLVDLLVKTQRFEEAFELCRSTGAWGKLQFEMRTIAHWNDLSEVDRACIEQLTEGRASSCAPWGLLQMPDASPILQRAAALQFAIKELSELKTRPLCDSSKQLNPDGRLKIGYLSYDFFDHATLHLLAGVLEMHDRNSFDINIYSYGPQREDAYTARLRATGLHIVDISEMSDQAAAREIHGHKVDILVELKGYTTSARLGITALRPAPIIVNWLGYPGTLGHPRLAGYIIGDPVVTPPQDAAFYSERLALMPHCYQPNDHLRPLPEAPTRSRVGLPETGLVFCSFNQVMKFNPQTFDIWSRLLATVPNSVLWLLRPKSSVAVENLKQEMKARGISEDKIVFAEFAPQKEHLARLRLADIALDTFPYNSHTTASDALWMGVPVITRKGKTFASRVAESLLAAHGFPDLVAEDPEEYFQLALDVAQNCERHGELKERLERARTTSPLFDTARFTKNLERLYIAIAENHNQPEETRLPVVTLS